MSIEPVALPPAEDAAGAMARLGATLLASGAIDQRTLDRARRVAGETGGRLDHVLTQLGLVSERGLAEVLAQLIGVPLVAVTDYPDAPLFLDRLRAKFLRRARALPRRHRLGGEAVSRGVRGRRARVGRERYP